MKPADPAPRAAAPAGEAVGKAAGAGAGAPPQAVSAAAAAATPQAARKERRLIFFIIIASFKFYLHAFAWRKNVFAAFIVYENVFEYNSRFYQNQARYFRQVARRLTVPPGWCPAHGILCRGRGR